VGWGLKDRDFWQNFFVRLTLLKLGRVILDTVQAWLTLSALGTQNRSAENGTVGLNLRQE
jgi:hypothetical protein